MTLTDCLIRDGRLGATVLSFSTNTPTQRAWWHHPCMNWIPMSKMLPLGARPLWEMHFPYTLDLLSLKVITIISIQVASSKWISRAKTQQHKKHSRQKPPTKETKGVIASKLKRWWLGLGKSINFLVNSIVLGRRTMEFHKSSTSFLCSL